MLQLRQWLRGVIEYGLDGIDVDYEVAIRNIWIVLVIMRFLRTLLR